MVTIKCEKTGYHAELEFKLKVLIVHFVFCTCTIFNVSDHIMVKGPWTPKLTYIFHPFS